MLFRSDGNQQMLSVITRMELLVWKNATASQLQILHGFIDNSTIFGLDEAVIVETINIRKNYGIKLPDAIIAARRKVFVKDWTLKNNY